LLNNQGKSGEGGKKKGNLHTHLKMKCAGSGARLSTRSRQIVGRAQRYEGGEDYTTEVHQNHEASEWAFLIYLKKARVLSSRQGGEKKKCGEV